LLRLCVLADGKLLAAAVGFLRTVCEREFRLSAMPREMIMACLMLLTREKVEAFRLMLLLD
jgi:hypothetical protein